MCNVDIDHTSAIRVKVSEILIRKICAGAHSKGRGAKQIILPS